MNIFYIDKDPAAAATMMVDKHVCKMIIESAQLLSTAHRILDGTEYIGATKTGRKVKRWRLDDWREDYMYQATHINHPSAIWTRESVYNYDWLYQHFKALNEEFKHRYDKKHACSNLIKCFYVIPHNIPDIPFTQPPPAMAKEYIISEDSVTNYRNYYKSGKTHLHAWKKREAPQWIL